MSFDYDKLKGRQNQGGEHWTSYSDLFMVLSVVFLLLYVVASIRNGTQNIYKSMEYKKVISKNEDLKRQIQAYNTLKNDYLKKEAEENEVKMYKDLMSHLNLLQDKATDEKNELIKKAQANEKKVAALNQYQQMIRNIVNTNLLAKKQIKRRDTLIVKKNETITDKIEEIKELDETVSKQADEIKNKAEMINQQDQKISHMNSEIQEKESELEQTVKVVENLSENVKEKENILKAKEQALSSLNSKFKNKVKKLKVSYLKEKKSKIEMDRAVTRLRLQKMKELKQLKEQKESIEGNLQNLNSKLVSASEELNEASRLIEQQKNEKLALQKEREEQSRKFNEEKERLEGEFAAKMDSQRKALEKELESQKASASEKARKLAEFKQKADQEKAQLNQALSALNDEVGKTKQDLDAAKDKLAKAKAEHDRYLASIKDLKSENKDLSGDVSKYKKLANAKKNLAKKIAAALRAKGVKASVDGKSGDVTLSFGEDYFEVGRADLKKSMEKTLQKFVPVYAKSLLEDKNIAENLKDVEIVGFSSPTYRGKYVDPNSLDPSDRSALNYNLDLSYKRAKSIFEYMFDKKKMNFKHQKNILPFVKVTGKSFLAEGVQGRNIASGLTTKQYCKKYNCKKSQKVIVRFNLKD